jgi:hypothetical protein
LQPVQLVQIIFAQEPLSEEITSAFAFSAPGRARAAKPAEGRARTTLRVRLGAGVAG